jgi:hypothetical protein
MAARRTSTDHGRVCVAVLMNEVLYSGHENFSESTEEIAPLTEEEKKQRLEELRAKMAEKKAKQATLDKEDQKKNEVGSGPFRAHCSSCLYTTLSSLLSSCTHKLTCLLSEN